MLRDLSRIAEIFEEEVTGLGAICSQLQEKCVFLALPFQEVEWQETLAFDKLQLKQAGAYYQRHPVFGHIVAFSLDNKSNRPRESSSRTIFETPA